MEESEAIFKTLFSNLESNNHIEKEICKSHSLVNCQSNEPVNLDFLPGVEGVNVDPSVLLNTEQMKVDCPDTTNKNSITHSLNVKRGLKLNENTQQNLSLIHDSQESRIHTPEFLSITKKESDSSCTTNVNSLTHYKKIKQQDLNENIQKNHSVIHDSFNSDTSFASHYLTAEENIVDNAMKLEILSEVNVRDFESADLKPVTYSEVECSELCSSSSNLYYKKVKRDLDLNENTQQNLSVIHDSFNSDTSAISNYLSVEENSFDSNMESATFSHFKVTNSESADFKPVSYSEVESSALCSISVGLANQSVSRATVVGPTEIGTISESEITNTLHISSTGPDNTYNFQQAIAGEEIYYLSQKKLLLQLIYFSGNQIEYIADMKGFLRTQAQYFLAQTYMIDRQKTLLDGHKQLFIENQDNIENAFNFIAGLCQNLKYLGNYQTLSNKYVNVVKYFFEEFQTMGQTIFVENEALYMGIYALFQTPEITYKDYSAKILNYAITIGTRAKFFKAHADLCKERAEICLGHSENCLFYVEVLQAYASTIPSKAELFLYHMETFKTDFRDLKFHAYIFQTYEKYSIEYMVKLTDLADKLVDTLEKLKVSEIKQCEFQQKASC